MEFYLSEKMLSALEFASVAHKEQLRKRSGHPYVSHVFAVGLILSKAGFTEDVVIAGILHDVIEDTKFGYKDIEERFGKNVADMVMGVTEDASLPWRERKEAYRKNLETQSNEVKAISAADLLANRIDLLIDLKKGTNIHQTFRKGTDANIHTEIDRKRIETIKATLSSPIIDELEKVIKEINKFI